MLDDVPDVVPVSKLTAPAADVNTVEASKLFQKSAVQDEHDAALVKTSVGDQGLAADGSATN